MQGPGRAGGDCSSQFRRATPLLFPPRPHPLRAQTSVHSATQTSLAQSTHPIISPVRATHRGRRRLPPTRTHPRTSGLWLPLLLASRESLVAARSRALPHAACFFPSRACVGAAPPRKPPASTASAVPEQTRRAKCLPCPAHSAQPAPPSCPP